MSVESADLTIVLNEAKDGSDLIRRAYALLGTDFVNYLRKQRVKMFPGLIDFHCKDESTNCFVRDLLRIMFAGREFEMRLLMQHHQLKYEEVSFPEYPEGYSMDVLEVIRW